MIKNYYYDSSTAPLKFHKFILYFFLPLSIVLNLLNLYLISTSPAGGSRLSSVNIFFAAMAAGVSFLGFSGLLSRKSYGWYAVVSSPALAVVYCAVFFFMSLKKAEVEYIYLAGLTLSLIFGALLYVYYKKRKALFFTDKIERYYAAAPRCPHCGHPIEPGRQFCPMCGMSYSMYTELDYDEYQNQ